VATSRRSSCVEVRSRYRGWHVALLLDEDPCHTARASLRQAEGMTLLWLPSRSPELNPMDTLWGQAKDVVSANGQYTTIEEHVDRFLDYVTGLTNGEALHTSGVLSRKFWLKGVLSN
jgi:DDE superfamily endonuclease